MVAKMMRVRALFIFIQKGKGYAPAEDNSGEYHGFTPKKDDDNNCKGECFTDAFEKLCLHLPIKTTAYMLLRLP